MNFNSNHFYSSLHSLPSNTSIKFPMWHKTRPFPIQFNALLKFREIFNTNNKTAQNSNNINCKLCKLCIDPIQMICLQRLSAGLSDMTAKWNEHSMKLLIRVEKFRRVECFPVNHESWFPKVSVAYCISRLHGLCKTNSRRGHDIMLCVREQKSRFASIALRQFVW